MIGRRAGRAWLLVQVLAIIGLFGGSLAAIWRAGAEAIARDRRRADAVRMLAKADDALALRGARGLVVVPDWPDTLDPEVWPLLDEWLTEQAARALVPFPGVGGGYFIPAADRYLGHAGPTRAEIGSTRGRPSRLASDPPSRERDLIDDQVREALERDRPIDRVVEMFPEAVAVRAAPVLINKRRVAATWLVVRLGAEGTLERSVRTYQWATGLALGGLTLAIALTGSLTASIRRHVAQRNRMEVELRRNERLAALGKLLAGVSHELRNPLAGIRSAAQLWQRGIVSDEELASELVGEVDRLDAIIVDLLRFTRAEPKTLAPGNVNEVVAEAARLARTQADAQGVIVDVDLAQDARPVAHDPAAILQVVRNLTCNAIQAMPSGGRLRLSTRRDAARRTLEVIVEDSGPGLPAEAKAHLFEPFFTTKPDGTGLGLAIAREIALAHGGDLRAANRRGGGAEFVLSLMEGEAPR